MRQDCATDCARPFLRWAGSKRRVLGRIEQFWSPKFGTYIEPFAGSASLFFRLNPEKAVLSDLNASLIQTLRSVRDTHRQVFDHLSDWKRSKREYYLLRHMDPRNLPLPRRAARFIYLNRFCFNGIYRTNNAGMFNVPYAPERTGALPTLQQLRSCSQALRNVTLRCCDFDLAVRANAKKNDFVYLDPPYATLRRRIFREYTPGSFSITDLTRLRDLLCDLDGLGCRFVVSYAYCSEALKMFSKWHLTGHYVQRNVAGFRRCRRRAKELLITNI